jgi:transcriptional regulator with GAF, ATPase, and Fis domain
VIRLTQIAPGGQAAQSELDRSFEQDVIRIGRIEDNDFIVPEAVVSSRHAQVSLRPEGYLLEDLNSTNGTHIERGGKTIALDEEGSKEALLEGGDVVLLGPGPHVLRFLVEIREADEHQRFVAVRRISDFAGAVPVERDQNKLQGLYDALKRIGQTSDLSEVLGEVCDACFSLVKAATHATIVIRDDDGGAKDASSYVPVITRVRSAAPGTAPTVPISRSVFRKVLAEGAAVLAADASEEVGQTESILGAKIRSTMGVPLWKGADVIGVIQLDNRESVGMFGAADVEMVGVLAHNVSLAVANARLLQRLQVAEERLRKENAFLKGREQERRTGSKAASVPQIIGKSPAIETLLAQLDRVVDTKVAVLIEGETGSGKELIASSVHYRSKRRDKLFVAQNCAALPENLLESELFGHKRGAFTGATDEKKGLFEIADGGTLFLDEVTEMPLSLQSKMLRALQEGEIRPVGSTQERKVNVRIVAATNRSLEKEVQAGRFREDLFYRLSVFPLRVPPLRERREDIPLLAEYFLKRWSLEIGKAAPGFAQETLELMQVYDWPGNIRELQNEVQRLMIQIDAGGFVTPDLLSPQVRQVGGIIDRARPAKGTLKEMMDQVERFVLVEALRDHGNNKTATAKELGITREGLHKKLRQFGLS